MDVIALLGAVDSGKTTFFSTFTGQKILEKKNTTQELRFKNVTVKERDFQIIDIPGHDLFKLEKTVAVTLSDLIVCIADYNKPNLSVLSKLYTTKPVLVLLNKADLYFKKTPESLKTLCSETQRHKLYDLYESFTTKIHEPLNRPLAYFLDAELADLTTHYIVFPISLRTRWAVDELSTYLTKFLCHKKVSNDRYLFLSNRKKFRYVYFGERELPTEDLMLIIEGRKYPLTTMSYNHATKEYTLPEDLHTNSSSKVLLRLYTSSDTEAGHLPTSIVNDYSEIHQSATLEHLASELKKYSLVSGDLKFYLYADNWARVELLVKMFRDLDLKYEILAREVLNKDLSLSPRIHVFWSEKLKLKVHESKTNNLVAEDLYELVDGLISCLADRLQKKKTEFSEKFRCFTIAKLLNQNLFKHHKKQLVIGARLVCGTLQHGDYYLVDRDFKVLNTAKLESIQSCRKNYNKWTDPEINIAVKLDLEHLYEERDTYLISQACYKQKDKYRNLLIKKQYHNAEMSNILTRLKNQSLNIMLSDDQN